MKICAFCGFGAMIPNQQRPGLQPVQKVQTGQIQFQPQMPSTPIQPQPIQHQLPSSFPQTQPLQAQPVLPAPTPASTTPADSGIVEFFVAILLLTIPSYEIRGNQPSSFSPFRFIPNHRSLVTSNAYFPSHYAHVYPYHSYSPHTAHYFPRINPFHAFSHDAQAYPKSCRCSQFESFWRNSSISTSA